MNRNMAVKYLGAYRVGKYHLTAVGVEMEYYAIGIKFLCLFKSLLGVYPAGAAYFAKYLIYINCCTVGCGNGACKY